LSLSPPGGEAHILCTWGLSGTSGTVDGPTRLALSLLAPPALSRHRCFPPPRLRATYPSSERLRRCACTAAWRPSTGRAFARFVIARSALRAALYPPAPWPAPPAGVPGVRWRALSTIQLVTESLRVARIAQMQKTGNTHKMSDGKAVSAYISTLRNIGIVQITWCCLGAPLGCPRTNLL